ncbi:MAG: cyclodeaminase/cyclohydrolase family protein [Candidatus Omnitrophota bacterium]
MKKFKNHTLQEYLKQLSLKVPVPGGGSAAALVGSLGAALISMVANYSIGRNKPKDVERKIKDILKKSESIRLRLMELVDLDAQAYLKVVKTRHASPQIKKAALKKAAGVPAEVCRLCYEAILLTPFLVEKGNRYLVSDIQVATEMLLAAFNSAIINVEVNQ